MTERTKIKPALTPEEWGKQLGASAYIHPRDGGEDLDGKAFLGRGNGALLVAYDGGYARQPVDDRHALAALALHDQPFGFTWEDVDALRCGADMIEDEWGGEPAPDLLNLADRIAALVPPRGEEGA